MKRPWFILTLLFTFCLAAMAQQSPPPDILASQTAAANDLQAYKKWAEGQISSLWSGLLQLQSQTAPFPQDEANIATLQRLVTTLQQQNQALADRITALEQSRTASLFTLSVASNASYTGAVLLQGATIKGQAWVFTTLVAAPQSPAPQGNVTQVNYLLDGAAWPNVEHGIPFDFNGGGSTGFWDTTSVPNGTHTITQVVLKSDGTSETDSATFTVAN